MEEKEEERKINMASLCKLAEKIPRGFMEENVYESWKLWMGGRSGREAGASGRVRRYRRLCGCAYHHHH